MRPHVVVEETEFDQRGIERFKRFNNELIQLGFERAEEALDPAVLPGGSPDRFSDAGCRAERERSEIRAK